jgi:hypothetical protein
MEARDWFGLTGGILLFGIGMIVFVTALPAPSFHDNPNFFLSLFQAVRDVGWACWALGVVPVGIALAFLVNRD